jgi:hypothetical protein
MLSGCKLSGCRLSEGLPGRSLGVGVPDAFGAPNGVFSLRDGGVGLAGGNCSWESEGGGCWPSGLTGLALGEGGMARPSLGALSGTMSAGSI